METGNDLYIMVSKRPIHAFLKGVSKCKTMTKSITLITFNFRLFCVNKWRLGTSAFSLLFIK